MVKKYRTRAGTSSHEEPRRWYPVGPARQTSACLGLVGTQETSRLLGMVNLHLSLPSSRNYHDNVDIIGFPRKSRWLRETNTFKFYRITIDRKSSNAFSVSTYYHLFSNLSLDINSSCSINTVERRF